MRLLQIVSVITVCTFSGPVWAQTVDGTSTETYERSIRAMADTLDDAEKAIFAKGLMNIVITEYPAASGLEGLGLLSIMPAATEAAHITLNGYTLDEILERGRSLEPDQAVATTSGDGAPDDAIACLQANVAISNAVAEKGSYGFTLSFDVTNSLPWAMSGIRVGYRIITEGRSVAWDEDSSALSVSGGIEPGETRTLSTSLFSIPADAILPLVAEVEVLDVADPEQRLLIGEVTIIGWAEEPSAMTCAQ